MNMDPLKIGWSVICSRKRVPSKNYAIFRSKLPHNFIDMNVNNTKRTPRAPLFHGLKNMVKTSMGNPDASVPSSLPGFLAPTFSSNLGHEVLGRGNARFFWGLYWGGAHRPSEKAFFWGGNHEVVIFLGEVRVGFRGTN